MRVGRLRYLAPLVVAALISPLSGGIAFAQGDSPAAGTQATITQASAPTPCQINRARNGGVNVNWDNQRLKHVYPLGEWQRLDPNRRNFTDRTPNLGYIVMVKVGVYYSWSTCGGGQVSGGQVIGGQTGGGQAGTAGFKCEITPAANGAVRVSWNDIGQSANYVYPIGDPGRVTVGGRNYTDPQANIGYVAYAEVGGNAVWTICGEGDGSGTGDITCADSGPCGPGTPGGGDPGTPGGGDPGTPGGGDPGTPGGGDPGTPGTGNLVCQVVARGTTAVDVTWNNIGQSQDFVTPAGENKLPISGQLFIDGTPNASYEVSVVVGSQTISTTCANNAVTPPPTDWSCTVQGGPGQSSVVTWPAVAGAAKYRVRHIGNPGKVTTDTTYIDTGHPSSRPWYEVTRIGGSDTLPKTVTCSRPDLNTMAPTCRNWDPNRRYFFGIFAYRQDTFAQSYNAYDRNDVLMFNTAELGAPKLVSQRAHSAIAAFQFSWSIQKWRLTNGKAVKYIKPVNNGIEGLATRCGTLTSVTPIAVDGNDDGAIARAGHSVDFDIDGDGSLDRLDDWFGSDEGILVDRSIPGAIDGRHLFGDQGGRYADGFAKLALRDANGDGAVAGRELDGLALWTDANGNGVLDEGELSDLGDITSLSTSHQKYLSTATRADGSTVVTEDVWFNQVS
ncbi:MAG: hypothetical protein ACK5LN_13780 [Propioniciclava sp.]